MDFTALTVDFLKVLNNFTGSYGMAIIALTIIVRVVLWPLGISQQRSMRNMQLLQPKMKMIQERYKNNPQVQQQKLMEFYKEHNFNPMSGCLPLLIQMPIFILLYSALISPQFISEAGDSHFLFINRLDTTLRGVAGKSYDGVFNVSPKDRFVIYKNVKVFLGDEELDNVKLPKNAIKVQGDIVPNETVDFKIDIDSFNLKYSQLEKITAAQADVQDMNTREAETVKFERHDGYMAASVPTKAPQNEFNMDVFILILLFAGTMFLSQKIMTKMTMQNVAQDPMQAQSQKIMNTLMPIMFLPMFIFFPIPAGVFLYLIVSNIFQVVQTISINKQLELEDNNKKYSNKDLDNAKTVTPIETKTVEDDK